ncbi:unnamed protein product [Gordionus sp. m RMFG-2023]|uniref:cytoplasmic aconitate hydratase-like n=1 Tax=Gordionus sp. m RMFG-2023 TaxID=3053472 RepID=UPI0030E2F7FD
MISTTINKHLKPLMVDDVSYTYYDILAFLDEKFPESRGNYDKLPYCLRILLESQIRNLDDDQIKMQHIDEILKWPNKISDTINIVDAKIKSIDEEFAKNFEVTFRPSRVLFQDFTGIPALIDFAALRDVAYKNYKIDPMTINPMCPVDLIINNSIHIDHSKDLATQIKLVQQAKAHTKDLNDSTSSQNINNCQNTKAINTKSKNNNVIPSDGHMFRSPSNHLGHPFNSFLPPTTNFIAPHSQPILSYHPILLNPPIYNFYPPLPPYNPNPYFLPPTYSSNFNYTYSNNISSSYSLNQIPQNNYQFPNDNNKKLSKDVKIIKCKETKIELDPLHINGSFNAQSQTSNCQKPDQAKFKILEKLSQSGYLCPGLAIKNQVSELTNQEKEFEENFENDDTFEEVKDGCMICEAPPPSGQNKRYIFCPFHDTVTDCASTLINSYALEFERNRERLAFMKWASQNFRNVRLIPPGDGISHQIRLEYLCKIVMCPNELAEDFDRLLQNETDTGRLIYPDSLVGTDPHSTMVNGLGVFARNVGGIEVENVMLGRPITISIGNVVGVRLSGSLNTYVTSTDLVLTITKVLRGLPDTLNGSTVEFFGPGLGELTVTDRITVASMCPEYGALSAFFPFDLIALDYLSYTDRSEHEIRRMKSYFQSIRLLRDHSDSTQSDPIYSKVIDIDLSRVKTCISGPKKSQEKITFTGGPIPLSLLNRRGSADRADASVTQDSELSEEFELSLVDRNKAVDNLLADANDNFTLKRLRTPSLLPLIQYSHVILAAITSCTNSTNPSTMLAAGLLAKSAVESGLSIPAHVTASLSPGGPVSVAYLIDSLTLPYLRRLGFRVTGYGCSTCDANSGTDMNCLDCLMLGKSIPITDGPKQKAKNSNVMLCSFLSGHRNFEGRNIPHAGLNFLASPPLVVAYALAGTPQHDFLNDPFPIKSGQNKEIYLRNIWPTRAAIAEIEKRLVLTAIYRRLDKSIQTGNKDWQSISIPTCDSSLAHGLFPWNNSSSYLRCPPIFDNTVTPIHKSDFITEATDCLIEGARCIVFLGNCISTDHISPAGSIARNSPAAKYLAQTGLSPREFNSYGSRRGNYEVMVRGTFGNPRLVNQLLKTAKCKVPSNHSIHFPSRRTLSVYETALLYQVTRTPLMVLAGQLFGTGNPTRDWSAKGPRMLGVRVILAESFDNTYRIDLISVGIMPLIFVEGENAQTLKLNGTETFDIYGRMCDHLVDGRNPGMNSELFLKPRQTLGVKATTDDKAKEIHFKAILLAENEIECQYLQSGGILQHTLSKIVY